MQMEAAWQAEAAEEDAQDAARRREQQELWDRVAALEALVQQLRARGAATPSLPAAPAAGGPAANDAASTGSGSTAAAAALAGRSHTAATTMAPDPAPNSSSEDTEVRESAADGGNSIGRWGRLLVPFWGPGQASAPGNAPGSQDSAPSDDRHASMHEQRLAKHMQTSTSITERRVAEGTG